MKDTETLKTSKENEPLQGPKGEKKEKETLEKHFWTRLSPSSTFST